MRTLGVELAHMLKDREVDTVFGIPGVQCTRTYIVPTLKNKTICLYLKAGAL